MGRSVSFIVPGDVSTRITIVESDGALVFHVETVEGDVLGDLRGLFFDLPDFDAEAGSLEISDVVLDNGDAYQAKFGEGSVHSSTGGDANVNGDLIRSQGAFDVGVSFGTPGIGEDDVRSASFTLSSATRDLTLDDISLADFGVRYSSVGSQDDRTASLKLGGMAIGIPRNDSFGLLEDEDSVSHDLFANDDGVTPEVHVISASVDGIPFSSDGASYDWAFAYTNRDGTGLILGSLLVTDAGLATFTTDGADIDALYAGEAAELVFSYTVSPDGGLSYASAFSVLTVTGENDGPVLSGGDGSAALREDAADPRVTDSGIFDFNDPDLADAPDEHSAGAVFVSTSHSRRLTTMAAEVTAQTGATGTDGQVLWTVAAMNADLQFLAAGETVTEIYEVTVADLFGGTDTETVEVVLTGQNDLPDISVAAGDSFAARVFEHSPLAVGGKLSVVDPDVSDIVTVSVEGPVVTGDAGGLDPALLASFLTIGPDPVILAGQTMGRLSWSFDPGAEGFTHLARDEELVLSYTVIVEDGQAGIDRQRIDIVIVGVNTAPKMEDSEFWLQEKNKPLFEQGPLDTQDDDSDTLTLSVESVSAHGDLAHIISESVLLGLLSVSSQNGTYSAHFNSDPETFDFLNENARLELDYTVRATDPDGEFDEAIVRVVIEGTNDPLVLEPFTKRILSIDMPIGTRAHVTETDDPFSASGLLKYRELDILEAGDVQIDRVSAIVRGPDGERNYPDAFKGIATLGAPVVAGFRGEDTISWSYQSSEAFDFLREGEELLIVYKIHAQDLDVYAEQNVSILVAGTNDAPEAVDDVFVVRELQEDYLFSSAAPGILLGGVVLNDTDAEGQPLSLSPFLSVLNGGGSVENTPFIAANGTIVERSVGTITNYFYVPNENFGGVDIVQYKITDGDGGFDVGQAQIHVTAVADTPEVEISLAGGETSKIVYVTVTGSTQDNDGSETLVVTPDLSDAPADATIELLSSSESTKTYKVILDEVTDNFEISATATTTETSNGDSATSTTTALVEAQPIVASAIQLIDFKLRDVNPYSGGGASSLLDADTFVGAQFDRSFQAKDKEFDTYSLNGSVGAKIGFQPYAEISGASVDVDLASALARVTTVYDPVAETLKITTPGFTGLPALGSGFSVSSPAIDFGLDFIFEANFQTKLKVLNELILDPDVVGFDIDETIPIIDFEGNAQADLGPFLSIVANDLDYSEAALDTSLRTDNLIQTKAKVDNIAALSFDVDDFIFTFSGGTQNPFNDNLNFNFATFDLDLIADYFDVDINVGIDWLEKFTLNPGEMTARLKLSGGQQEYDEEFDFENGVELSDATRFFNADGNVDASLEFDVADATFLADPSLVLDVGPTISVGSFGVKARSGGLVLADIGVGPLVSWKKEIDLAEFDVGNDTVVDLDFASQSMDFGINIA